MTTDQLLFDEFEFVFGTEFWSKLLEIIVVCDDGDVTIADGDVNVVFDTWSSSNVVCIFLRFLV